MSPGQVCEVLGIDYARFLQLCHSGELRSTWCFTGYRVTERALEEYIAARLPVVAS